MMHNERETRSSVDFDSLVDEHQQKLYRVAYRIVGNSSEAQDIVQETFLRAFQNLHRLEDPAKLGAWLYQITVNLCRSWLRRQRTRLRILESDAALTYVPSLPPAPDEHLVRGELRDRILRAIEQLPPRQREVVELFYLQGESYQTIQEHLGISKGLLGWRLKQARQKLEYRLREAYQAAIPPLLWKLRWTVPFSIPVKFVLLSLLLHFGFYVSVPRVWVQFAPEQSPGIEDVSLPVALIEQGMVNLSGDGIVPQRTRRVPEAKPLPKSVRLVASPRAVDLPAAATPSLPHPSHDSSALPLTSEPTGMPPLSQGLHRPLRNIVDAPTKARTGSRYPRREGAVEHVATFETDAPAVEEPVTGIQEKLFFMQDGRLSMMDADGQGKQDILLTQSLYHRSYPRISIAPDATRFVFSGTAPGVYGIWIKELVPSTTLRLSMGELLTPDQAAHSAAWSPDGERIAFVSTVVRGCEDIWVMRADGSQRRNMTEDVTSNQEPAWSPDGRAILFSSTRQQHESSDIYLLDLVTGKRTRLTRDAGQNVSSSQPAWSPDGRTIAYTRGKNGTWTSSIYLMNADGKSKRELVENASQPAWSPDGSQLVFIRGRHAQSEVWTVQVDGQAPHRLTDDQEYQASPQWIRLATRTPDAQERPSGIPSILLPHEEGSSIMFLEFINERELMTVRQESPTVWYAEQRSINAPDEIIPPAFSLPGGPRRQHGIVTAVARRNAGIVFATWHPHSTMSMVYWWASPGNMVAFPNDGCSSFALGPGEEMVAVVRGEMEVRGPKQHGRLRGFGNNVVIARYAPVRYDTAEEHRVVSAHSDGTISVWDGAYPHDLLHQFPAHDAMIRDLIIFWNDDRMVAASCTRDGDVKLWDLSDGTQLGAILAEAADHLAVSPNARWLATSDGEITQLWDLSTLDHVRTLPGGGMLSFSTDGRWLANTLDGKGIGVWDLMAYSE